MCGRACQDWERRATEVRSHIRALEQDVASLGPARPVGADVEHRSRFLALFGADPDAARHILPLVLPFLQTLVMEIGTIVCLGYGLTRNRTQRRQTSVGASANEPPPGKRQPESMPANVVRFPAPRAPANGTSDREHPVIAALATAGRPLTNRELARLMGVSEGEASKRWQEVATRLLVSRQGRWRVVSLPAAADQRATG